MLTQIILDRFKCFDHLYMPLKPLTLIAGINGAGKSSVIQALLLLRQSCKDKDFDWSKSVVINGGLVDLDDASSLLYANASGEDADMVVSLENDDEDEITFRILPRQENGAASCSAEGDLDKAGIHGRCFRMISFTSMPIGSSRAASTPKAATRGWTAGWETARPATPPF